MPLLLKGSCRCNAVRFEVESHTPVPFMLCYCSICRKQQGGENQAVKGRRQVVPLRQEQRQRRRDGEREGRRDHIADDRRHAAQQPGAEPQDDGKGDKRIDRGIEDHGTNKKGKS